MRRAAVLLALLAAACSDASTPGERTAGTYVLRTVAGDPLPAVTFETASGRTIAAADTLRFRADGRGTAARAYGFVDAQGRVTEAEPVAVPFTYQLAGGLVALSFDCPPTALCAAGPHLVLRPVDGGLRAEAALGERVPRAYERVLAP